MTFMIQKVPKKSNVAAIRSFFGELKNRSGFVHSHILPPKLYKTYWSHSCAWTKICMFTNSLKLIDAIHSNSLPKRKSLWRNIKKKNHLSLYFGTSYASKCNSNQKTLVDNLGKYLYYISWSTLCSISVVILRRVHQTKSMLQWIDDDVHYGSISYGVSSPGIQNSEDLMYIG